MMADGVGNEGDGVRALDEGRGREVGRAWEGTSMTQP